MNEDTNWLTHDHAEYEAILYDCQSAAEQEDWKTATRLFRELVSHIKLHMHMEEEVLYPAYEQTMNAPQGPTLALREEHDEIYRLLRDLSHVIKTNDSHLFLESLLPLEKVLFKHHEKEEEIFLPMASFVLLSQRDEIMRRLKVFDKDIPSKRAWDF